MSSIPTPPVGTSGTSGSGALTAFTYATPPTADTGNTLTAVAPAPHAAATSVGVNAPGTTASPRSTANATTSPRKSGATR